MSSFKEISSQKVISFLKITDKDSNEVIMDKPIKNILPENNK